jgi:predicted nucleic acid-binding protein
MTSPMPVVSNTSPILNLAIIGQLNWLRQQFGTIQIPPTVLNELKVDEDRPGSSSVRAALTDGWLQVNPLGDVTIAKLLRQTLDGGEAEAIALALALQAEWILLDERDGRRAAKSLGLQVTGILGVLLRAKAAGEVASLQPVVDDLIEKAGFRLAPDLLEKILEA